MEPQASGQALDNSCVGVLSRIVYPLDVDSKELRLRLFKYLQHKAALEPAFALFFACDDLGSVRDEVACGLSPFLSGLLTIVDEVGVTEQLLLYAAVEVFGLALDLRYGRGGSGEVLMVPDSGCVRKHISLDVPDPGVYVLVDRG